MTNCLKRKRVKILYLLCSMALLVGSTLEASDNPLDMYGNDHTGRNQSFVHPKFGPIFGINIFKLSNFAHDSDAKQNQWNPGSPYYRHCVLPQEGIDTHKAYQRMDELYRENHPDIACKYEVLMAKTEPKIPLITHSVWFTNPFQPRELKDQFLHWYQESCRMNSKDKGWRHILWVQDRNKLPHTTGWLEHRGVEIKEMYKELTDEEFCGLRPQVDHELSQSKFGRAADVFRAIVLYKYGGIYRDIDFEMTRPFTGLALAYDFFAGIEHAYSYPCNAMMGCRPGHPIISKLMEIMRRNLDSSKAPAYVQDSLQKHGDLLHTICATGPVALGVAVKTTILANGATEHGLPIYAQPDGHKDRNIIFPPEVFFNIKDGRSHASFGWHAFATTWLKDGSKG
ncbi:glycosyltransferase family 32 protein [Candidatus Finniella inopinata]|uniref:Glycosyl transferase n=1 Tax=Candidatus Finniella inopinata TaxID=1696036 RepID=A0A4Q7DGW2_9PROT|nr:glycosyltransferase [Candidatus Finniella inopinata]RZI45329.1 hypothetical protein EQU50_07290 [Candidatus Finniella inopinata]